MAGPQPKNREYFHDRPILIFLAVNAFLVFVIAASIFLRLAGESNNEFIKEYKPHLGLGAYPPGNIGDILAFVAFGVITFVFQLFISKKMYHMRRDLALIVIFMTTLTLIFSLIIANSLLSISS